MNPSPPQKIWVKRLHWALGVLVLASVAGYFGGWFWLFDVLSHFRLQYALGAGVLAGGAFFMRRRLALAVAMAA